MKLSIITSRGGHLYQVVQLLSLFKEYKRFWITFPGEDVDFFLENEKKYFAHYPESRNGINFFRNIFLAVKIFKKEKPNLLISGGAGMAVPFFIIGKFFFGTKLIYIEPYDFVHHPSLTGRIVYNFVDLFLVQHLIQKKWFPKAKYWGSIL